jgi:hypothetical protein
MYRVRVSGRTRTSSEARVYDKLGISWINMHSAFFKVWRSSHAWYNTRHDGGARNECVENWRSAQKVVGVRNV